MREHTTELLLRKAVPHSWGLFLLLAGGAKTGWHSDNVIRCCRNLKRLSFVMDICNLVRLDTGVLVILNIFGSQGTGDVSKVIFESFQIDEILFIDFT